MDLLPPDDLPYIYPNLSSVNIIGKYADLPFVVEL
jgi:hypothetical protein